MTERIALIIPTYNEKENIENIINALRDEFLKHSLNGYVLVSDANSKDGTGEIVDKLTEKYHSGTFTVRVIHEKEKRGLGRAYVEAFKYCIKDRVDLILQMDADFSHDPRSVINLIQAVRNGADLSIGSRYVKGGGVKDWGILRVLLSRFGSFYARTILGVPIYDYTGGFTCFRRKVLEEMNPDSFKANGYSFQVEIKYKTYKSGYKVVEVPIIFKDRTAGKSKMSSNIIMEAAKNVWLLRWGKI